MKTRALAASLFATLLFVALAILPARVRAEGGAGVKTVHFQNGRDNYSGALEIGIGQTNPDATSTAKFLWINSPVSGAEDEKQVLIRFDRIIGQAPGLIPPRAPVTKAVLRLWLGNTKRAESSHRVYFHRMLVPWKRTATWDTFDGNGVNPDGREAAAEPDETCVFFATGQYYEVDVTAAVRAWANGSPNHGWVLLDVRTDSGNATGFHTSADKPDARPELIVSYEDGPRNAAPAAASPSATPASATSARLALAVSDADGDPLEIVFEGRRQDAPPDYKVVILPDTQYYVAGTHGGTQKMFLKQVDWIVQEFRAQNIACVLHLGDISDRGDAAPEQWQNARRALYRLEDPKTTGLPDGIPYSPAVGNHDQRNKDASDWDGPAELYNKHFGVAHFQGKSYYGGHYGNKNNNHFIFFNAGAEKFIVLNMEFNAAGRDPRSIEWGRAVLQKYAGHRAIVVTHNTMGPGLQAPHTSDGRALYAAFKDCPNLMLIIGGHITGEGHRTDVHAGSVVHSILQDFQFDEFGGNGYLGILTFSPRRGKILVSIYSPFVNKARADSAGSYELDYDFGAKSPEFAELARVKARSGERVTCPWENLDPAASYEWRAAVSDGRKTTRTPPAVFSLSAKK
jgi:hypothetical protein